MTCNNYQKIWKMFTVVLDKTFPLLFIFEMTCQLPVCHRVLCIIIESCCNVISAIVLELTGQCKLTSRPRKQDRHLLRLLNQSFPQQYELFPQYTILNSCGCIEFGNNVIYFCFPDDQWREETICMLFLPHNKPLFFNGGSFQCVLYFSLWILLDELLVPERVCWAKPCCALSAAVAGCYVGPCSPSASTGPRQARVAWRHMQRGQWDLPQSHDQAQRWVQLMLWYIFTENYINSRSVLCVCEF